MATAQSTSKRDYSELLSAQLNAETFVRHALALLEYDFRELALLTLADWDRLMIPAPELFPALASMQRPSWGTWNGLIDALRNARKNVLRNTGIEERTQIEKAVILNRTLGALDERLSKDDAESIRPLATLTNTSIGRTLKILNLFTLSIALRNRLAHDAPADASWWENTSFALKPVVRFFAARDFPYQISDDNSAYISPWFLVEDQKIWSFNGLDRNYHVNYVSRDGSPRFSSETSNQVLLAFKRILGKTEVQEKDFKKLLAKLAPEEMKGVIMGDYLVGRPVGSGGFGTVHKGYQLSTGRKVAIKILHDGLPPDAKARFQQEASYLSKFDYSGIVGVIEYGEEAWMAPRQFSLSDEDWFKEFSRTASIKSFIAMEWIEGLTLEEFISRKDILRPSIGTITDWFAQASGAVTAVHSAGLIHRDVKPNNIMVTSMEGVVKLMDFGVARTQAETRTLMTTVGQAVGTPAYMSPEQIRSTLDPDAEVGPSTDIYSLCATFYEVYTGKRLFQHDTVATEKVRAQKLKGDRPSPPRSLVINLPWEIDTILLGGLQPEIPDRYQSAAALERDIRHVKNDEPIEYKRPSISRRAQLFYRRNQTVTNIAVAFLLLAVVGVFMYVRNIRQEQANTLRQLLALYEEQGRQELLNGNPHRALVYLNEAYRQGGSGSTLRYLLARAMAPYDAQLFKLENSATQVKAAAYSKDGRFIIAAGGIPTGEKFGSYSAAQVWDAKTGKRLLVLHTSKEQSASVEKMIERGQFSPDGKRIITTGTDVRIWDSTSGEQLALLQGAKLAAFSPDGLRIVTTNDDRTATLWDATAVAAQLTLEDNAKIQSAQFSPDGQKLITHSDNGTTKLWDSMTGRQLLYVEDGGAEQGTPAFLPNGKQFITSGYTEQRFWDAETGKLLLTLEGNQIRYSPDGKRLAVVKSAPEKSVLIVAAEDGRRLSSISDEDAILQIEFSPDGNRLLTLSPTNTAKIWDVDSGKWLATLPGQKYGIKFATFSPSGQHVLTIGEGPNYNDPATMMVWAASGNELLTSIEEPNVKPSRDSSFAAIVSPDAKHLITRSGKSEKAFALMDPITGEIRTKLEGFEGNENSIVFSPDGKRIIAVRRNYSGTSDPEEMKVAKIWELTSGKLLSTLEGHSGAIETYTFSPDGQQVVTTSMDKTAKVWDVGSGKLLNTMEGNTYVLNGATFSPDGRRLVTCSQDTLKVWDVASGKLLLSLDDNTRGATPIFSPDGNHILSSSGDGSIKLRDAATGKIETTIKFEIYERQTFEFSPDGSRIITTGVTGNGPVQAMTIALWDAASGRQISELGGGLYQFSPDGKRVVTASTEEGSREENSNTIDIWNSEDGKLLRSFKAFDRVLMYAGYSADGKRIVGLSQDEASKISRKEWDAETGTLVVDSPGKKPIIGYNYNLSKNGEQIVAEYSNDSSIHLWDLEHDKTIAELSGSLANKYTWFSASLSGSIFSPDGKYLLTSKDNDAEIWDTEQGRLISSLRGHSNTVIYSVFSPNGQYVLTTSHDHTARIWLAESGKLLSVLEGHASSVTFGVFSPDSKLVLTNADDVKIWDAENGTLVATLKDEYSLITAVFSRDHSRLVTSSQWGGLKLWDSSNGHKLADLEDGCRACQTAGVFSPIDNTLLTSGTAGGASLWDSKSGRQLAALDRDSTGEIAFSQDGQRFFTSTQHGIKVWDTASAKMLLYLDGQTQAGSASFSPDGERFVTGVEQSVMVWDISGGKLLTTLSGHTGNVLVAAFTSEGGRIVSSGEDSTVKIWDSHLETRSPKEVSKLVESQIPLRLDQGRLVPVAAAESQVSVVTSRDTRASSFGQLLKVAIWLVIAFVAFMALSMVLLIVLARRLPKLRRGNHVVSWTNKLEDNHNEK